jgi:hypothetical protein
MRAGRPGGVASPPDATVQGQHAVEPVRERGADVPCRRQLRVLGPERLVGWPVPGVAALGAQQGVARRVPGVDELHDVDPVAGQPQQLGAEGVGEHVGEALPQDRVPHECGVRLGRGEAGGAGGGELTLHVVVAAGRGEEDGGAPGDGPGEGVVRSRVTGVQREDDVDVAPGVGGLDRPDRELEPRQAQLAGQTSTPRVRTPSGSRPVR